MLRMTHWFLFLIEMVLVTSVKSSNILFPGKRSTTQPVKPQSSVHSFKNKAKPLHAVARGSYVVATERDVVNNDHYFPSSNNFEFPTDSSEEGRVWSEWVDLPNTQIRKWNLLLKNVSYQNETLYIHLPEGSTYSTSGLKSHVRNMNLKIINSPLDWATCKTIEKRSVTFAFLGFNQNPYITNLGHLMINVLLPLFRYLFYVHNGLKNLKDDSLIPDHQLPLRDTLLLVNMATSLTRAPIFLFDVVLRFASSYALDTDYFQSIGHGQKHCFESIDVPLRDPVDPLHPGQPPKVMQYGVWDTMHYSHKGRWGRDDFYYNFWRNSKKQIWQLYDIPILFGLNTSVSSSSDMLLKPKLSFMARTGCSTYRCDGNLKDIRETLGKDFDVTIFDGGFYRWHSKDDKLRYKLTRNTLSAVQATDVMLGQTGSNNQLALFLQENKVLVEMKNYMYCANEAAKALANHNRLSFYTSRVSDVGIIRKNEPVHYDPARISKLSKEILSAWKSEVRSLDHETNMDSWLSTCDFIWPYEDPAIISKERIITRDNVSRCYLEQVPGKGWYQVGTHKNVGIKKCDSTSIPPNSEVLTCMVHGLC